MSIQSIMRRGYKRAVYDMLCGREPMGILDYTARVGTTKRMPKQVDKNGAKYVGQSRCVFGKNNAMLYIWEVDGGYVKTSDGKRHRISSVGLLW